MRGHSRNFLTLKYFYCFFGGKKEKSIEINSAPKAFLPLEKKTALPPRYWLQPSLCNTRHNTYNPVSTSIWYLEILFCTLSLWICLFFCLARIDWHWFLIHQYIINRKSFLISLTDGKWFFEQLPLFVVLEQYNWPSESTSMVFRSRYCNEGPEEQK